LLVSGKTEISCFMSSANASRLILYFPVSALVTLFANILQNPQDPRARADVKLMNLVVNFLSMLVSDEENGSVKRMLGVCAEFERIAKVVLDKADRDSNTKRKRKTVPEKEIKNVQTLQAIVTGKPVTPARPQTQPNTSPPSVYNQQINGGSQTFGTPQGPVFTPPPDFSNSTTFTPAFEADFADLLAQQNGMDTAMANGQQIPNNMASPLNLGIFQQPFVPQDLWQMPMTLEWDWADMTNTGMPSYEHPDGPNAGMPLP
jgi:hypothetical protein